MYVCEGDDLVPAAFRGDGCTDCQKGMSSLRCKVGEGITGRAAATGKSVVVGSGLDCEFAVHIPGTAELEESLAAVPLLCASRTTGVLVISQLGADAFGEDVVRLLEMLAGHVAVALEKARRYERQRDEAREAKALLAFSDSLLELDSFDEVAREAVRGVARVLDVPEVSLWVRTHTGGTRRLAHIGELRAHRTEELVSALRGVNGWLALRPAGPDGQLDDRRLRLLAELARLISLALRKTR